jgi:hypothetical protein
MAPKAEKAPAVKGDKAPAKKTLSKDGKKKAKSLGCIPHEFPCPSIPVGCRLFRHSGKSLCYCFERNAVHRRFYLTHVLRNVSVLLLKS